MESSANEEKPISIFGFESFSLDLDYRPRITMFWKWAPGNGITLPSSLSPTPLLMIADDDSSKLGKYIFKFMCVVWFLRPLPLASTIYSRHTDSRCLPVYGDINADAQVYATFQHWMDTYSFTKCTSVRFIFYYSMPGKNHRRLHFAFVFVVDDRRQYLCAHFSSFFRIFMMPNGSSAASIKYDAIGYPLREDVLCLFGSWLSTQ